MLGSEAWAGHSVDTVTLEEEDEVGWSWALP